MKQKIKKQGRVIRRYKRNIPVKDFNKWKDLIRRRARGHGLYALYDGSELVYVGLATQGSIKKRIEEHARNKDFTHFSAFLVAGHSCDVQKRRIRDLEALLLKIIKSRPKYNKNETKFVAARKLAPSTVSE